MQPKISQIFKRKERVEDDVIKEKVRKTEITELVHTENETDGDGEEEAEIMQELTAGPSPSSGNNNNNNNNNNITV